MIKKKALKAFMNKFTKRCYNILLIKVINILMKVSFDDHPVKHVCESDLQTLLHF